MKINLYSLLLLGIVLLSCASVESLKHHLKIKNDRRGRFYIENFGFEANGQLEMVVTNFMLNKKPFIPSEQVPRESLGFLIKRTDLDANQMVTEENSLVSQKDCLSTFTTHPEDQVIYINETSEGKYTQKTITIEEGKEGFYNIYFINCLPFEVSFELKLTMFNIDRYGARNYLSSGYSPLPTIFGVFVIIYAIMLIVWIFAFLLSSGSKVNHLHQLMTVLVILKLFSLFFKTIDYHFVKTTGSPSGWNIPYYIFAVLKTITLFVLIALMGTGWQFLKPFLQDREKKIFLVVIPLQILANVAMIILEETAPGSLEWRTWSDIFYLVDIICCAAIIVPIFWSIKHLRQAAQIDGKAAVSLRKLALFREFYLLVVSWIYFTRLIVYLVGSVLPFRMVWMADFFSEAATILFFCTVAYKFRPNPDNPYFSLETSEEMENFTKRELSDEDDV